MVGLFNKLKDALIKTSSKIGSGIDHLFIKKKLDDAALDELHDLLISTDTGVATASTIIDILRKRKFNKEVSSEEIKLELANIISDILKKQNYEFLINENKLNIILFCGVNGNGKTTTIGKMAAIYTAQGKKVAIAACDTFRAAATNQLGTWAERSGAEMFYGDDGADPASVAYMAVSKSLASGVSVLFIDTAGRLQNQKNLMEELSKIIRVIKKIDESAPHHTLLVIDGTTGQNAFAQTEQFKNIAAVSGLIITKLDGTAKAGGVVGIVDKFSLPVHFIGIGEGVGDLKEFNAEAFAQALVGL
jgi:fused signal recognition particle receptor